MKAFITGVNGQLGYDLMFELQKRGHEPMGTDRGNAFCDIASGVIQGFDYVPHDLTDFESVANTIRRFQPDVVFHCAAWTNVDAAEDQENQKAVRAINVDATLNIAHVCREIGSKMVYLSTDYVFGGEGDQPWEPDDKCFAPLNAYGKSKLDGELAVSETLDKFYIVRTAWVFGHNGKNFVKTMIRVGKTHDSVRVVNDQIGTPTYTHDLARLLVDMAETDRYGFYHATNEGGYISWYDFCKEFYRQYGLNTEIIPVSTEEYGLSKALRPHNSRLAKQKLVESGFQPLQPWQDAVAEYLKGEEF